MGQLYLSNIDFLKNGVPASVIATLVSVDRCWKRRSLTLYSGCGDAGIRAHEAHRVRVYLFQVTCYADRMLQAMMRQPSMCMTSTQSRMCRPLICSASGSVYPTFYLLRIYLDPSRYMYSRASRGAFQVARAVVASLLTIITDVLSAHFSCVGNVSFRWAEERST